MPPPSQPSLGGQREYRLGQGQNYHAILPPEEEGYAMVSCMPFLVHNIQFSRQRVVFEHVRLPILHMVPVRENLLSVVNEYR